MTISLLNKITLTLIHDYIERSLKDDKVLPSNLMSLKGNIEGYLTFHKFTVDEAEKVLQIGKEDGLMAIMNKNISYIIFSMEVMKLWIENIPKKYRPSNISDKKYKLGGKYFFMAMLKLKNEEPEEYDRKKDIIDNSINVAHEFWEYHFDKLKGEEFIKAISNA